MNQAMQERLSTADFIKGVAIVLMVYGHIMHQGAFAPWEEKAVKLIYTFHMPLFLLISGFFSRVETVDDRALVKLARRLLVPYFVFISLYLLGLALAQDIVPTSNTPRLALISLLDTVFLHPIGGYWFIHSLAVIGLSGIVSDWVCRRVLIGRGGRLVFLVFLLAIASSFHIIQPRTVMYFMLGVFVRMFNNSLPASIPCGVVLIVALFLLSNDELYSFSFAQVSWSLSIVTLLAGIGKAMESTPLLIFFSWVGRNTLIILLLHPLFINAMKLLSKLIISFDASGLLYSLFVVIITVSGSLVCAYLFDKARISLYIFGTDAIYSPR